MNNILQSVWMPLMQILYSWNGLIIASVGIVSSAVLGVFLKVSKHNWRWVLLVVIPSVLVFFGVEHTHKVYTYVPAINFEEESLEHVHESLEGAGLTYSDEALTLDAEALIHLSAGENLYSYNFRVVGSDPEPAEFVKQGTTVALTLSWFDPLSASSLSVEEMDDFDPQTFYDQAHVTSLNTWSLRFETTPIVLKRIHQNYEGGSGPSVRLSKKRIVRVQLFDFFTGELADEAICYLGDSVYFDPVFSGTYYYIAFCDGFQPSVSYELYQVYHDDSNPYDEAAWYLTLEKESEAYSTPFKIQLLDSEGIPLSGVSTRLGIFPNDQLTSFPYYDVFYTTNVDGYLCDYIPPPIDSSIDLSDDLNVIEFQVCDDYTVAVSLDGESYIPVPQANTSVISVVIDDTSSG